MATRKSAPKPGKPAKPRPKQSAAPHGPSEGKDKPAQRKDKAQPANPAPKKRAAPQKRGGAAAYAAPNTRKGGLSDSRQPEARNASAGKRAGQAAEAGSTPAPSSPKDADGATKRLMRATPAADPPAAVSDRLTMAEEAFLTEYLRNGQNGTAAWMFSHPGCTAGPASVSACQALRRPRIAARLANERNRLARKHELSRDQLLSEFLAIAKADPNELVQMRAVACQRCWGGGPHTHQWTEPDPDCEPCGGEGYTVPWIGDTRKLSADARALYAGIHQTKEGIKVLMHDKVAALTAAGRIIGAFEKDNEQQAKPIADTLREFFAQIHGDRLPIVKAPAPETAGSLAGHPLVGAS